MPNPAEAAAQKISWEMGSWKSIELRLSENFENRDPRRDSSQPRTYRATYRYVETSSNQRFYECSLVNDMDPGESFSVDYADGKRCASLYRSTMGGKTGLEQVEIKRWFGIESMGTTDRPGSLKFLYVGLKPLPEVLKTGSLVGEGRRLGRDCDQFLFSGVAGAKDTKRHVYWLDRETGLTLRYENYGDQADWSNGTPSFVWNAESIDAVEGRHVVLRSELVLFKPKGPNPREPNMIWRTTVDEVAFDRDYPATMFWPTITDRTLVIDSVADKVQFRKAATPPATTADPIRAVDPAGWAPSFSTSALLLGAAVLITGLVLHHRRG